MSNNLTKAKEALNATTINPQTNSQGMPIAGVWKGNQYYAQNGNMTPQRQMIYELAILIKKERINQKMSQRQLATLSGYSQGTITRLETRMWVSMNCVIAIALALGKKLSLTNK